MAGDGGTAGVESVAGRIFTGNCHHPMRASSFFEKRCKSSALFTTSSQRLRTDRALLSFRSGCGACSLLQKRVRSILGSRPHLTALLVYYSPALRTERQRRKGRKPATRDHSSSQPLHSRLQARL